MEKIKTYVLTLSKFFPSTHTYARENRHHFVTLSMRDRFSTEVQRVYTDTQRSTRYGQTIRYG